MKYGIGELKGRYWLPGFSIGALLFFVATVYIGYQIWQSSSRDNENVQQIKEFQALSQNALFFSRKISSGDTSAVDALNSTVDTMDATVTTLLGADQFTKDRLTDEYEEAVSAWRNIKSNAGVLTEVEYALSLVNAVADKLDVSASEAQKIFYSSTRQLASSGGSAAQMKALDEQALLLRTMAEQMAEFSTEVKAKSTAFDNFRRGIVTFDNNHSAILNGDRARGLSALRNKDVVADVLDVYSLIEGVRGADSYIVKAVEAILLARDAQSKIISSFEGLQFTLDDMAKSISGQGQDRFPRFVHGIITLVGFLLCLVGILLFMKLSSQRIINEEHEENEQTQGAILRLLDELADLADGDLTVTTTVSEDFTGAIADSVNYTIDQLRQLVSRINSTAVKVSGAAQESQQTALHLAEASDHQAQEIAGASAAINEMAVTIDQVSANASESATVASKSVSIANNGAKLVQNTIDGMDTIREQIQDTSKRIKRLGESSQEIGDIVSLINDIADQTNILALNAAIQASMAGDAGRGFAVVADEVQRLAERSAAATKQIESLVKTIQTDTNEAVISMEQTTSEVVSGARLAQDAGVALEEIEGVSANLAELIQNISNAARQQASSAGHISNTMNVIQEITSQTSAGTGATAQSIGELADMALDLRESVAGFKLPDDMSPETDIDLDGDDWLSADDVQPGSDVVAPAAAATATASTAAEGFEMTESLAEDIEKDLSELFDSDDSFDLSDDEDGFDLSDLDFDDDKDAGSAS